jgi:hypothetical protein
MILPKKGLNPKQKPVKDDPTTTVVLFAHVTKPEVRVRMRANAMSVLVRKTALHVKTIVHHAPKVVHHVQTIVLRAPIIAQHARKTVLHVPTI